ncbi:hypothetical protein GCM10025856_01810 [Methylophaga marina]|uniref:Uncharacterized protein n=1 Tax=Methylophaga marina TaxID=45495 RepID=A0ABN0TCJ2_9GAMM|nr:hypothetical protein GCM10025856_01810 [Methylophaga marina]
MSCYVDHERQTLANLISKNRIYKCCRGDILKPPVDYAIQAIKDSKTGLFYTDRCTVKQKCVIW